MITYKFDFSVDAGIQDIEIEAKNYEEAEKELLQMSLEDLINKGYVKDFNISDIDYEESGEPGENYSVEDIENWLKNRKDDDSTISDEDIEGMAQEIYDIAYDEESYADAPYESVDDIDIPELCDASTGSSDAAKLHNLYYILIGLEPEEGWEEEE